ncbi:MAG: rRNA maturation RNase YbeY [Arcobacteraceae bacterium]|nr:rRNA maturation RNase YbeY [Arcobacteraceae bacterium]
MINVANNIDLDNQTDIEFDFDLVNKITNDLTKKEVELIITNNATIQQINNEYRYKDEPTDVLSFPLEEMHNSPLGTIVISSDFVIQKAKEFGHTKDEEFALLYLHGILHLLGYDHELDDGQHREKEKEIIEKFDLPTSLIVRND